MQPHRSIPSHSRSLLCAAGLLALANSILLLPSAARAQDAPPQDAAWEEPAQPMPGATLAASAQPSSTGRPLLLLTLGLAGLLVGMERLASWQLGGHQGRAARDGAASTPGQHGQGAITMKAPEVSPVV